MKYILIVGNITFHHFDKEELSLFKTDKEQKALIHEIVSIQLYDDVKTAYENGDDAESYVLFPNFKGELVFENDADRLQAIKDIESLMPIESISEYSESLIKSLGL